MKNNRITGFFFEFGGDDTVSDPIQVPHNKNLFVELFNLPFGALDTVRFDVVTFAEAEMKPATLCKPGCVIPPDIDGVRPWLFCGCYPTLRGGVTGFYLPGGKIYRARFAGTHRSDIGVRWTLEDVRAQPLSPLELGCCQNSDSGPSFLPVITATCPAVACEETLFSYTPSASNEPVGWALLGTLPDGLSFNASTGVITGTPEDGQAGESFPFTLYALNGYGGGEPLQCTLDVLANLSSVSGCPPALIAGTPGSYTWDLPDDAGTVTGSATNLPTGVTINGNVLSWNGAQSPGSQNIAVTLSNGCSTKVINCTLLVVAALIDVDLAVTTSIEDGETFYVPPSGAYFPFVFTATNLGPVSANGATITSNALPRFPGEGDPQTLWHFTYAGGAAGAATCTHAQMQAGFAITTMPNGGSVTATCEANVPNIEAEQIMTFSVAAPIGYQDTVPSNNAGLVAVNFLPLE